MADRSSPSGTAPATVLVVEDEVQLADLYAAWLADDGYDVRTAYGGEEALAKLDETVDVVLLDRRMPRVSGDEVLERLRERDLDCRVVIVSAVTPDFDVVGMAFDDYLVKPVDVDQLRDVVERMLAIAAANEPTQELHRLWRTRAVLRDHYSVSELRARTEVGDLEERIASLRTNADVELDAFEGAAFDDPTRSLEFGTDDRHSGDDEQGGRTDER